MERLVVHSFYSIPTEVTIELGKYGTNNSLAISLWCAAIPPEPYARLTVNLPGAKPPIPYAYIDTNNCPWATEFIEKYKLGENTGMLGYSGYCSYPLYKFDIDLLRQIEKDGGIVDAG